MTLLRTWIVSVTACAMVIAAAEALMPDGAVKRVGKLTGSHLSAGAAAAPGEAGL